MATVFNNSSTEKPAVKYKPCKETDDELEEISIVQDKPSSPSCSEDSPYKHVTNGPNTIGCESTRVDKLNHNVRTKLIGERLSSSGTVSLSSPCYAGKVIEQKALTRKTPSQRSLFDSISNKIDRVTSRRRTHSKEEIAFLNAHLGSKEPITPKIVKKQRRKDIQEKFGKKNHQKFEKIETQPSSSSEHKDGCRWTFVFDPAGRLCYWWSSIVSIAFLYNFWIIIYRFAFNEIDKSSRALWFTLDYTADLVYVLDIVVHFRTGFLEDGVLQTSPRKMRLHYMNSSTFYIDCLCLLPLDFMYLSLGFKSMLRCFRLVKIYRFWAFLDRTERHTNYPNAVRTATLLHYLFVIFHWNACFVFLFAEKTQHTYRLMDSESFAVGGKLIVYLESLYWSTLALTTIGGLPKPQTLEDGGTEYVFVIVELVVALLLFATVLGHIANIVANVSAARKEFQAKLDGVKTYMSLRRVPLHLQDRVIKWFDYLWLSNKTSEEEKTLKLLPDKLKAEIAIHVHLDTLKRVEIFQNTEAGFLCELVLKLCPVLFSPGDYICRKGEIGKEMYIVNRGRLQVVADNGKTVLATLKPGSYFGEISILNMGNAGNRRTASVRSVGYSDLFRLSKQDLWDVLKEYPAARVRLEAIAVRRLEKYKKEPIENALLTRSQSTPGLVESMGNTSVVVPTTSNNHTVPLTLDKCQHRRSNSVSGPLTHDHDTLEDDVFLTSSPKHKETNDTLAEADANDSDINSANRQNYENSNNMMHSCPAAKEDKQMTLSSATPPQQLLMPSIVMTNTDLGSGKNLVLPSSPLTLSSPCHLNPYQMTRSNTNYQIPSPGARSLTPNYLVPVSPSGIGMAHHAASYGALNNLNPNIPADGSSSRDPPQDILLQELKRLRERVASLETENAGMSIKLNQQQWEVESRLAEIEMQICGSDSLGSVGSQASAVSDRSNKESVL